MLENSDLGFVLSSSDIEKLKYFNSDGSDRQTVVVWVEARADKRFWGVILNDNEKYSFDLKTADEFVSVDGKTATGCKRLLSLKNNGDLVLGKNNIFCLDSDDDFLVSIFDPDHSARCDYIYYTKIHSIDNAFIHPGHADRVLENLTACRLTALCFKPSDLLSEFSFDAFEMVKMLSFSLKYLPETGIVFRSKLQEQMTSLKTIEINEPLSTSKIYLDFRSGMSGLVQQLRSEISKSEEDRYIDFEKIIVNAGLNKTNAHLFVRGHDMFEMVVSIFERISKDLRSREIARIKSVNKNPRDAIKAVHNEWVDYGDSLKTGFYTANLEIDFLSETFDILKRDYA
ncbi:DUF4435 domain-containing protein [Pseudomonas moraviensis]